MNYKKSTTLLGWMTFALSLIVYALTLEPSVSFWDCGEFIASSYKLQIGHPPGAPFFMLVTRIFSLFAPGTESVAYSMNLFSGAVSAATVMFLFWTIVYLLEKIVDVEKNKWIILASGFIGAMSFAFTDTFWFSAVEAEVYAFSSLFTAVVFWAILKWEREADKPYANRWIVLIAYLMGLSIGVHLLNLLAIPAIALVYYYKKYEPTKKGLVIALGTSFAIVAAIMWVLIPGIPKIAAKIDVLFVNSFSMPFNSGLLFFLLLSLAALAWGIWYSHKKQNPLLNIITTSVLVIIIGYTSFGLIVIRSSANPPMDENNPQDAYALMKYLNREQYGSTPLFSGQYYNAPAVASEPSSKDYYQFEGKYVETRKNGAPIYANEFTTIFPRMWSNQPHHIQEYKRWGKIDGENIKYNGKTYNVPTFGENLRYFFSYQVGHMYFRYFFWNFSGRQNHIQGHGDPFNGNWITGIPFIDKARLGVDTKLPSNMAEESTHNRYFMLPFLLGLLGLFYQYKKDKRDFWVVMTLFFLTGVAIVFYLNQYPRQPRERDYAFAGSFYAYAIWIGIGVMGLAEFLRKYLSPKTAGIVATVVSLIVPTLLISENYDDHDRSGRFIAREVARNYVKDLPENSILFTYADNDTFPLWYLQDVEGVRTDVRVCCYTLLSADWHINQMQRKAYESTPLPIEMPLSKYVGTNRNFIVIHDRLNKPYDLKKLVDMALMDDDRYKLDVGRSTKYNYFPTKQVQIPVDKEAVLRSGVVAPEDAHLIEDTLTWTLKGNSVTKGEFAILNLLANMEWDRPVYFAPSVVSVMNLGLEEYLQFEGLGYRFVPIKTSARSGQKGHINTNILYNNFVESYDWGNANDSTIFLDETSQHTLRVLNLKGMGTRLAQALIYEGKEDKAKATLDHIAEVFPYHTIAYEYEDLRIALLYYQMGNNEEGDHIVRSITENSMMTLDYILDQSQRAVDMSKSKIEREIAVVQQLQQVSSQMGRTDLSKEIEASINMLGL